MNPLNKISGNTRNSLEKDLNVETRIDDVITTLRPALLHSIKKHVAIRSYRVLFETNRD
jgi:hypothetical protein